MKIFRKNNGEAMRGSLIRSVDKAYKKIQTSWVKLMERLTKNFRRRTWVIVLIIYAIWAISLCCYIILSAIR